MVFVLPAGVAALGPGAAAAAVGGKGGISLGTVLGIASLAVGALGTFAQMGAAGRQSDVYSQLARNQEILADRRAQQLEQQAGQERAASQRAAAQERRRLRRAQSRLQAVAGASGAGALDPTVLDLEGDLAAEGEFRALSRLFEGESEARNLEYGATLERHGGQVDSFIFGERARQARRARTGALVSGAGRILGGVSLLEKYG